jgi:DNA ligase (NAD+)
MSTRIQELAEQIRYHSDLYYNQSKPELSDAEFDALIEELRGLDPENPVLSEIGANTTFGKKVKHASVMGSLDKVNSHPTLQKWYGDYAGQKLTLTPKIDGCACKLIFEDGKLVQAATRGDGMEGQDVTANVNVIASIPKTLSVAFSGELRGEIYMKRSVWEKMGSSSNPRNVATGSLLQKDPTVTAERNLSFFAYDIIFKDPRKVTFMTEEAKLNFMASLTGIDVVPRFVFDGISADLLAALFDWENNKRAKLDYEIDGMVLSVNELEKQEEAGWSGKCPRAKVAYKFKPEQKIAEVVRVEWFVGRIGKVTPVAVITPTRLGGTTVTNVTLHNHGNVKALDLGIGDKVLVEKAGDIIPQIVRVVEHSLATNPQQVVPAVCPVCGEALNVEGVHLMCNNAACPAQFARNVLHFIECIGVLGIGPGIVDKLCNAGMVKNLADLYYLDQNALAQLLGGTRAAEKVYMAIMEKGELDLAVFLDGLGIDGLGTSTSKSVAKQFKTLQAVRAAGIGDFLHIEGIGATTTQKIVDGLKDMSPTIDRLTKCVEVKEVADLKGNLTGMSFCLTGALSKQRNLVEKDIEAAGGECKSSVGRGLTYLVQSDASSTSSKSEKAKKLGTQVIDEATLYAMIG